MKKISIEKKLYPWDFSYDNKSHFQLCPNLKQSEKKNDTKIFSHSSKKKITFNNLGEIFQLNKVRKLCPTKNCLVP